MTPWELSVESDGYIERLRDAHRVQARYTAAVMNCWRAKGSRAIKPSDLLDGVEKSRPISLTGIGMDRAMEILKKRPTAPQ